MRVTLALAVVLVLAGPALGAGWAQENAEVANQGRIDREGPGSLEEARFASLDGRVLTQVVEGPASLALAGTVPGSVVALDAAGEVVWQRSLDAEIRTAPLWTGEHVVVLPRGDRAYAFDAAGDEAWTLPVDNHRGATLVRMASPVEHPSGDIILATMAGKVHRVMPNGSTVWTAEIGEDEAIEATPAITSEGDVVAAAFEPGRDEHGLLARIDGDTGDTVWEREIGAQVVGAPTVIADTVLVPLRDGNALEARALSDGSQRWETAFDASITASPTLHEGKAIVGDIRGTLRALEISGGREAWSFHPRGDDPDVNALQSATYTIADSVAVDGTGTAWVSYWVADLTDSGCCPPQDSTQSPVYRLDAGDGELLHRQTHPKAHHGPSVHATGVWAGSDEEGVRAWPKGPSLEAHAWAKGGQARLVVNTDRSGPWSIEWGQQVRDEGQGRPPPLAQQTLEAGTHTVTVTVEDARASDTVTIEADGDQPSDDQEREPTSGDEEPNTSPSDEQTPGPNEPAPSPVEEPDDEVPLAWIAAVLALLAAAGVRSRA